MRFLWCCCPADEPEWATDCSAVGSMPGSEWTMELPEFCIDGTMWGQGHNYTHRDLAGSCGGWDSDCSPRYFRWFFVRWQDDSSDPADCNPDFCDDYTLRDQIPTCGDGFITVGSDGYVVDQGGSSTITDIRWRTCTTRKTNDPYGCAGTPSGDDWIISEIDIDFRWVDPIIVAFKTATDCVTTIDRSAEAENTWFATYVRRIKAGEPVAEGTYTLSRLIWGGNAACIAVTTGGAYCTGPSSVGGELCIEHLGDSLDTTDCETMWKPPSTITVYKSA